MAWALALHTVPYRLWMMSRPSMFLLSAISAQPNLLFLALAEMNKGMAAHIDHDLSHMIAKCYSRMGIGHSLCHQDRFVGRNQEKLYCVWVWAFHLLQSAGASNLLQDTSTCVSVLSCAVHLIVLMTPMTLRGLTMSQAQHVSRCCCKARYRLARPFFDLASTVQLLL